MALIAGYPDVAFLFDGDQHCVLASGAGEKLLAATDEAGLEAIQILARGCATSGHGLIKDLGLKTGPETQRYRFAAQPLSDDEGTICWVGLMGHNITLETNITSALADSRRRYKDLVECSADFAWETDASGRFCFVSPAMVLGHEASSLNGMPAHDLYLESRPAPSPSPFAARQTVSGVEAWLVTGNEGGACVNISAVPITDSDGNWRGARGLCHDITDARRMDEALSRVRRRETLLANLIASIRDVVDPAETVSLAAQQSVAATDAVACRIWRREGDRFIVAATGGADGLPFDDMFSLSTDRLAQWPIDGAASQGGASLNREGRANLLFWSAHQGLTNGAIALAADDGRRAWPEDTRKLVAGVAGHLGIVMEQIGNRLRLEKLSRTDALTGLLNRRSLEEEAEKRLAHLKRTGGSAALFFIDLDNFKQVNDQLGHDIGDRVLTTLARNLQGQVRSYDLAARCGGDEFVLWFEDMTREAAAERAQAILRFADELRKLAPVAGKQLSLSVGIAMARPVADQTVAGLVKAADEAMYKIKHGQKAGVAFADPPDTDNRESG